MSAPTAGGTFDAYKVGLGRDLDTMGHYLRNGEWRHAWRFARRVAPRVGTRSWWALWQCDDDTARFARRGFTARGAVRKMRRDATIHALTGKPSLWQTWRAAKADGLSKSEIQVAVRTRAAELVWLTQ